MKEIIAVVLSFIAIITFAIVGIGWLIVNSLAHCPPGYTLYTQSGGSSVEACFRVGDGVLPRAR